jgi:TP901 family phage tail tape measure protein
MADRSIVVRLKAEVSGFQSAMAAASRSTKDAEQDLARFSENGGTSLGRLTTSATQHREAWSAAGTALLGFGAAAVAGVGLAIKSFADFDSRMAQVSSLSHAGASDMASLTDAALHMGQQIGYSANDVADAEIELVKAGISVKDILGGALSGALTLAAAGQIDVADATEIATIAMTQFGLAGKDIPHVADLLAAGADKALGGVSELGWALKSGGLVAHQFDMSIEDTVGTLALFAQNGLMGEAAGTDLRQMLLKLAAPSKEAQRDLDQLGITVYNSQGKFTGIVSLAGQLQSKMNGLSEAERNAMMAHIFGARSIVGANILYQAGAEGVQGWIDAVNDSGFAAKQAAGKMDSLNGDMKKLQAAWENGMIQMGGTADGFLRPIIQSVTGLINQFDALPEPVKGAVLGFTAVVGVGALVAGTFLTVTPKILDTVNGFRQLSADGSKVPGLLGSIAKAAGLVAIGFTAISAISNIFTAKQTSSVEDMTQAIIDLNKTGKTASIDTMFQKWDSSFGSGPADHIHNLNDAVHELADPHVPAVLQNIADGIQSFTGGAKSDLGQITDRFKSMGDAMGNLTNSGNLQTAATTFNKISDAFQKNGKSAQDALDVLPGYKNALQEMANQAGVSLSAQDLLNLAMGKIPPQLAAATDATGSYVDAAGNIQVVSKEVQKALADIGLSADGTVASLAKLVKGFEAAGLTQISANEALSNYLASLDAVDASIKKNGTSLDLHTEKGRANQKALDDVASAGLKLIEVNAQNGASQEELSKNLQTTYDDLLANYKAFGITGQKADDMARSVLGIPKNVPIDTAIQNYADSMMKLNGLQTAAQNLNGFVVRVPVEISVSNSAALDPATYATGQGRARQGNAVFEATGGPIGFATGGTAGGYPFGGLLDGPGGGTSDSINARLSKGEYVIPAARVKQYGVPLFEQIRAGKFQQPAPSYQASPMLSTGGGSNRSAGTTVHQTNNIYEANDGAQVALDVIRRLSMVRA